MQEQGNVPGGGQPMPGEGMPASEPQSQGGMPTQQIGVEPTASQAQAQPQEEMMEPPKSGGKFGAALIGFILGAVLVGGGVFYWQNMGLENVKQEAKDEAKAEYEQQITDLEEQVADLETQLEEANTALEEAKAEAEEEDEEIGEDEDEEEEEAGGGVSRGEEEEDMEGELGGAALEEEGELTPEEEDATVEEGVTEDETDTTAEV